MNFDKFDVFEFMWYKFHELLIKSELGVKLSQLTLIPIKLEFVCMTRNGKL